MKDNDEVIGQQKKLHDQVEANMEKKDEHHHHCHEHEGKHAHHEHEHHGEDKDKTLVIFVNRIKFDRDSGVKHKMTANDIAKLVDLTAETRRRRSFGHGRN
jgi:hypothetical protein